jgi:hypothetical protein
MSMPLRFGDALLQDSIVAARAVRTVVNKI